MLNASVLPSSLNLNCLKVFLYEWVKIFYIKNNFMQIIFSFNIFPLFLLHHHMILRCHKLTVNLIFSQCMKRVKFKGFSSSKYLISQTPPPPSAFSHTPKIYLFICFNSENVQHCFKKDGFFSFWRNSFMPVNYSK